jgi:hypothetical protein
MLDLLAGIFILALLPQKPVKNNFGTQYLRLMALNCGLPSRDGSEPSKECRLG